MNEHDRLIPRNLPLQEQLEELRGQLLATQTAVLALVYCHPMPTAAVNALTAALERLKADQLAQPVSEHLVAGVFAAAPKLLPRPTD